MQLEDIDDELALIYISWAKEDNKAEKLIMNHNKSLVTNRKIKYKKISSWF